MRVLGAWASFICEAHTHVKVISIYIFNIFIYLQLMIRVPSAWAYLRHLIHMWSSHTFENDEYIYTYSSWYVYLACEFRIYIYILITFTHALGTRMYMHIYAYTYVYLAETHALGTRFMSSEYMRFIHNARAYIYMYILTAHDVCIQFVSFIHSTRALFICIRVWMKKHTHYEWSARIKNEEAHALWMKLTHH